MRLLLDTQVLWWMFYEPERLRPAVVAALSSAEADIHYSPLSLAELIVKRNAGKFSFDEHEFRAALDAGGLKEVPLRGAHAIRTGGLPPHHKDPFGRLMIAQAVEEEMLMVSADTVFPRYGIPMIRA